MKRVATVIFLTVCASVMSMQTHSGATASTDYDLVIRGGRVIDGSGSAGVTTDVAINGDRIVKIGNLRGAKAKREIDARGQVVAPGFIDMLGQSETFVLIDPRAMSKVMMGVTTEITGRNPD